MTRDLEVECLPNEIPQNIVLDVAPLHIGQHVEAGELELPEGVIPVTDAERVIVSVALQKVVEEEVEEDEDELLLEAEAEEPEVIQRGKAEEEAGD